LTERILEAHATVSNLDGIEAKLRYLKAWQALPEFGITTFGVKFKESNKKEVFLFSYYLSSLLLLFFRNYLVLLRIVFYV
jgi:kindlin 2